MISDDDLLLYYYRELDAAERARIGAALAEQPELARRLHALVARLDAVAATPDVPVPAETQRRWEAALAQAAARTDARQTAPRRWFLQPGWQAAAAATLVATLIISIQQLRNPATGIVVDNTPAMATPANPEASQASAYENGLKFHLASTERRLAALEDASPEDRARLVEAIIGQNRIYALAAERAGEPQLARVLRAFTPILQSVAEGRSESTASDLAQLNFELRVMQARLGANRTPSNTL